MSTDSSVPPRIVPRHPYREMPQGQTRFLTIFMYRHHPPKAGRPLPVVHGDGPTQLSSILVPVHAKACVSRLYNVDANTLEHVYRFRRRERHGHLAAVERLPHAWSRPFEKRGNALCFPKPTLNSRLTPCNETGTRHYRYGTTSPKPDCPRWHVSSLDRSVFLSLALAERPVAGHEPLDHRHD